MTLQRVLSTVAVAASLVAAPTFALAVNVSSNDGSGIQYRTASFQTGADVTGNLKSTNGAPVYYQGLVNYPFPCDNDFIGRYTSDTTSRTAVTRGGRIAGAPGFGCNAPKVNSRVARNVNNLPDPVGSYSADY